MTLDPASPPAPAPTVTPPVAPAPPAALSGARAALVLLLAINLFNYIDRQVLSAVLGHIRADPVIIAPNDPDAGKKLGLLTTAFLVSYMLLAPLFGWLGDRYSRWFLIGLGVIVWSLASGGSGLATGFLVLLLTRCLVGIGEAAYGPVAPSVISDLYPVSVRGQVLAWFYMAIPVGSALGFVIGGQVADTSWGWRGAFGVVVVPGLLLGVLCFLRRDPPRGQADAAAVRHVSWSDYPVLGRTPSYVLNTLGMTAMTFVLGGVAAWMPVYVFDREARFQITADRLQAPATAALPEDVRQKLRRVASDEVLTVPRFTARLAEALDPGEQSQYNETLQKAFQVAGWSLGTISTVFGAIVVVSGLGATLLGGWLGDRLRVRLGGSYFLVAGVGMLLGFPLFLAVLFTPFPLAWVPLFLAVFSLFLNTGPTNTALANVVHPSMRSAAFALNILIIHTFGDAISPLVIGAISDAWSLQAAFLIVSVLILLSGLFWLAGARHLAEDTRLAVTRIGRV
jgi:MFS family permease